MCDLCALLRCKLKKYRLGRSPSSNHLARLRIIIASAFLVRRAFRRLSVLDIESETVVSPLRSLVFCLKRTSDWSIDWCNCHLFCEFETWLNWNIDVSSYAVGVKILFWSDNGPITCLYASSTLYNRSPCNSLMALNPTIFEGDKWLLTSVASFFGKRTK